MKRKQKYFFMSRKWLGPFFVCGLFLIIVSITTSEAMPTVSKFSVIFGAFLLIPTGIKIARWKEQERLLRQRRER